MISRITFWSAHPAVILSARLGPMPSHLAQALRRLLDNVEDVLAEHLHQSLRIDRADPLDHAGPKVFLDPVDTGGGRGSQELCFELEPVRPVVEPDPGGGDPLPRRDHRGVPHRGHQVPMAPGLDPQDTEAVLRIVEGDPFHQPRQDLGRAFRSRGHARSAHPPDRLVADLEQRRDLGD